MFLNIIAYTIGAIVAIPILLWFAIRGLFTGSWKLLGFVCQRQYRELKRLCECGTPDELQAFLEAHPGAVEYIVYTRRNRATSIVTMLFRLPAPLDVAGHANNLAVIPVLLANGASPEVRSVSATLTPAEDAIGDPERMRVLCGGKTWWLESSATGNASMLKGIRECNHRCIIWNVMRGARLTSHTQFQSHAFLRLPMVMKEFVCRFGVDENQRGKFFSQLKRIPSEAQEKLTTHHFHSPMSPRSVSLRKGYDEMMKALEEAMQPLPAIDEDTRNRLLFSARLIERSQLLEQLDNLFTWEQQFAMLKLFTTTPLSEDDRDMTEMGVDLLLCSILEKTKGCA